MIPLYLMTLSILAAVEWAFTESLFCDHLKNKVFSANSSAVLFFVNYLMLITSVLVLEHLSQESQPRQELVCLNCPFVCPHCSVPYPLIQLILLGL